MISGIWMNGRVLLERAQWSTSVARSKHGCTMLIIHQGYDVCLLLAVHYLPSTVRPPSTVYSLPSTVHLHRALSNVHHQLSPDHRLPSTIPVHHPPSTIYRLPSTVHHPPSTIHSPVHRPPSTIHHTASTIRHPPLAQSVSSQRHFAATQASCLICYLQNKKCK